MKPNIAELRGGKVAFEDGTEEPIDAIIYATGYKTTFPFLPKEVFDPEREAGELYRRIMAPGAPGLLFAGLVQPIGATIPLVETQGKWIAAALKGDMKLPDTATQRREIDAHRARQRRTYLDTARYQLEVDYGLYTKQMKADMAARAAGEG